MIDISSEMRDIAPARGYFFEAKPDSLKANFEGRLFLSASKLANRLTRDYTKLAEDDPDAPDFPMLENDLAWLDIIVTTEKGDMKISWYREVGQDTRLAGVKPEAGDMVINFGKLLAKSGDESWELNMTDRGGLWNKGKDFGLFQNEKSFRLSKGGLGVDENMRETLHVISKALAEGGNVKRLAWKTADKEEIGTGGGGGIKVNLPQRQVSGPVEIPIPL